MLADFSSIDVDLPSRGHRSSTIGRPDPTHYDTRGLTVQVRLQGQGLADWDLKPPLAAVICKHYEVRPIALIPASYHELCGDISGEIQDVI